MLPCTWTGFVGKTIRNLLCISERPDRRDSQSLDREICRDRDRLACPDHHSTQKQHALQCTIIQIHSIWYYRKTQGMTRKYTYINTPCHSQIHNHPVLHANTPHQLVAPWGEHPLLWPHWPRYRRQSTVDDRSHWSSCIACVTSFCLSSKAIAVVAAIKVTVLEAL